MVAATYLFCNGNRGTKGGKLKRFTDSQPLLCVYVKGRNPWEGRTTTTCVGRDEGGERGVLTKGKRQARPGGEVSFLRN